MKEVVSDREKVAKEKMKASYDRQAKDRQLEEGTLVLVRTPDLKGKLEDVWDRPFEVTRCISPVTYEIAVPRWRSKRMVTHIDSLNVWNTPATSVLNLVVVGGEVEGG